MCIKYPNVHEVQKKQEVLRIPTSQPQFKKICSSKRTQDVPKIALNSDFSSDLSGQKSVQEPPSKKPIQATVSKTNLINGSAALVFISVMIHASLCKSCPQLSCRKMRVVLQHHNSCKRVEQSLACQVCEQLMSVVTKHAVESCTVAGGVKCPVPFCDSIKQTNLIKLMG